MLHYTIMNLLDSEAPIEQSGRFALADSRWTDHEAVAFSSHIGVK